MFLILLLPIFGVEPGMKIKAVKAAYAPIGEQQGKWLGPEGQGRLRHLSYQCQAEQRCFLSPSEAEFSFLDGKLATASLRFNADAGPPGYSLMRILLKLEGEAKLGRPVAVSSAAGRRSRYFFLKGQTQVWVQDGRDTEIKLYLDKLNPLGRAEAVAAGAPPQSLKGLWGGKAYAAAHKAISKREFSVAIKALEKVRSKRRASPLLKEQAKAILALALAARGLKQRQGREALKDLERALELDPDLAAHLESQIKALRSAP